MFKIPSESKRFSQPNTSDVMGNVWITKNITFAEEGYIKLQRRSVLLKSEKNDSNFDLPLSFGRYDNGSFFLVTADEAFLANVSQDNISVTQDSAINAPSLSFNSAGRWWQNRWHATTQTEMWYRTVSGAAWTNTGISLTTGVSHPVEVFRNKNMIAVGDGNEVKLYDTSYSLQETLVLPSDFEVVGLSYSNNRLGIITRLGNATEGQNEDAFFFVWDGGSAEANGGFPIGSDAAFAVVAYSSTWLIVNRTGQVLKYNGGGFSELSPFPFVALEEIWGNTLNKELFGDAMQVDGDTVFINTNFDIDAFGKKQEVYLPQNPAGVWCYDPKVGLYHTYSPSISPATTGLVTADGVDPSTDILTLLSGTVPATGTPVAYTVRGDEAIGGLLPGTIYYVIKLTSSTFRLALTKEDAINNLFIDITSAGVGDNDFLFVEILDYGATLGGGRSAAVALIGDKDAVRDKVIFGGDYRDFASNSSFAGVCASINLFPNIGYFVTPKISSADMQDMYARVVMKFRQLGENEKIVLKYKCIDVIGVPTTTPQFRQSATSCSWTSDTTFTTTADISEIKALIDSGHQAECEIISGAGAGQMPQISSITFLAGVYTVTLAESVDGAASGRKCNVSMDSWAEFATLTDADTDGVYRETLSVPSKWVKIKVQMRGVDVTVEELQIINKTQEISE